MCRVLFHTKDDHRLLKQKTFLPSPECPAWWQIPLCLRALYYPLSGMMPLSLACQGTSSESQVCWRNFISFLFHWHISPQIPSNGYEGEKKKDTQHIPTSMTVGKERLVSHVLFEGPVSKIHKEFWQLNKKMTNNPIKNWAKESTFLH